MDREGTGGDRLGALIDLIAGTLDEPVRAEDLAGRAFFSRYHFAHLVSRGLRESPGAFRRRLLLERAAWQLIWLSEPVTDVALGAGYRSADGFGRAFRRAFGVAPSRAAARVRSFHLPSPNAIHFHPPAGLLLPAPTVSEGRPLMDLTDRLVQHDLSVTRELLDAAARLSEDRLDEALPTAAPRMPYDASEPTLRSMLDRIVSTKEIWTAAIAGRPLEERTDRSIQGLRERLDAAGGEFVDLVSQIRERDEWDTAFVDALCDPPETFTFGAMVAHVLTFNAYRRQTVIGALRGLVAGRHRDRRSDRVGALTGVTPVSPFARSAFAAGRTRFIRLR